ncbi:uncharacterized protein LOC119689250 [Teleopsis dalmanni]|uniref:uncharacterized protein LOC119689250 n=1 Tax=Teleopsis dalmanni TaxID=139649 RepID=UPI0018CCA3DD|nr:uncharacterized protein LOC119689250 [Teleopsis dalmanni]
MPSKLLKKGKLKRNFWLASEVECMLKLIKDMQSSQGTTATTHFTFVQIANKMRKYGFVNKSPTQIRRKWFQMKSAYLCFKRGNTERLFLIPERFRSIIAQFVEAEYKNGKSPSACLVTGDRDQESNINTDISGTYGKFLTNVRNNCFLLNRDFREMNKSLILFERKQQSIRDSLFAKFFNNFLHSTS